MNEHFEQNSSSESQQAEPDLLTLVKKIQQHLVYLEKKIDTLIGQSSDRPAKGRHFSKPFRPFNNNRSRHHGEGNRDDRPRERSFGHDRPFNRDRGDRPRGGDSHGSGFGADKKPFFRRRRERD